MPGKPKILFLTLYPGAAASSRYRVEQFIPYLKQQGFECTVASALTPEEFNANLSPRAYHLVETRRRVAQLLRARRYDIVFVQKALTTAYVRGMQLLLLNRAGRVVYDFDDAVHVTPPTRLRGIWRTLEDPSQIRRIMQHAALALAGNAWLAQEAAQYAARVELFPTVVDTTRFVPATPERTSQFVIGWIGGPSTTPHLKIASALDALEGVTLRCVGADPAKVPWKNADVRPWSIEREVAEIQQFAVGIMPLPADDWVRGKCALKALQYMACGVPCVATPFGAIRDMATHNHDILFAETNEEWRAAIEQLRDPAERKRIGDAGCATVERRFSLANAAPRLAALLESVS